MTEQTWNEERVAETLLAAEAERRDLGRFTDEWPGLDLETAYRVQRLIVDRKIEQGHTVVDRLSFEVITLPPLRAREGDIEVLATYFGQRMAAVLGWEEWPGFGPRALAAKRPLRRQARRLLRPSVCSRRIS